MKTVQREPKLTGCSAKSAFCENSRTSCFSEWAKVSMNEPQPDEQASLS